MYFFLIYEEHNHILKYITQRHKLLSFECLSSPSGYVVVWGIREALRIRRAAWRAFLRQLQAVQTLTHSKPDSEGFGGQLIRFFPPFYHINADLGKHVCLNLKDTIELFYPPGGF